MDDILSAVAFFKENDKKINFYLIIACTIKIKIVNLQYKIKTVTN